MQSAPWHTSPLSYDTVRKLCRSLGTSEIMATVLARRGYTDPETARGFLLSEGTIHDPFLFPGMEDACRRLRRAFAAGEEICVHGDYDVDGITSTALLARVFRKLGGKVSCHLPDRFSEGYGVSPNTVSRVAEQGVSLLVMVDCGISAKAELEETSRLGLDTIVIDHHRPVEGSVPPGTIISPLLCDYPFKELAGVGLAFKLAQALLAEEAESGSGGELHPFLRQQLDLVALGTIADVVPLVDENRALVKRGLVQMARTRSPGLKALMRIGQVDPSRLNAGMVAFRLAPRINAAGRLEDPGKALSLLLAESEEEAGELADVLNGLNQQRQRIENQMLAEAQEMVNRWPEEEKSLRGYVLSSPGWHEGVIGIVASRLVEIHHRPVIMIAEDGTLGKGSGRSIPAFDLHGALSELGGQLATFGGHRAACGLTIDLQHLEDFRRGFARLADESLGKDDLRPSRHVDALVLGRELTLDLAEELAKMEPFGLGNPSVDLLAAGARIDGGRKTRDGQHLQCRVESGGASSQAIGFGQAYLLEHIKPGTSWDVVFRLERNEFNGSVSPQLNLRALYPRSVEPERTGDADCTHCDSSCPGRVRGEEFWSLLSTGAPLPEPWLAADSGGEAMDAAAPVVNESDDRVIDRRDYGAVPQQIARIIAGGESVLLLVADSARRRELLFRETPLAGGVPGDALVVGVRCSRSIIASRLRAVADGSDAPALMMADFVTAASTPGLVDAFDHLVFVDPPFSSAVFASLAALASRAWLHLIYCGDEVQFTKRVLEHEYSLRASLTGLYQRLQAERTHPLDETMERLVLGGGRYLRNPQTAVRGLKVLEELGLISIEDSREESILTMLSVERTELERSRTFQLSQGFHDRCQKQLNRLQKTRTT